MARTLDPNEPDEADIDLSELFCPKCGCNAVTVTTWPRGDAATQTENGWVGKWFGGIGKATCNFCGTTFRFRTDTEDS